MNESFGMPSDNDQVPTLLSKAIEEFKTTKFHSIPKIHEIEKRNTKSRRPIKQLCNKDVEIMAAENNMPSMIQMDPSVLIGTSPKIIKRKGYDHMVSTKLSMR